MQRTPYAGFGETPQACYGPPTLIQPRLGQGAFRAIVTDTYGRQCAGVWRTHPARARRYPHPPLCRRGRAHPLERSPPSGDIHSLFDAGYVTITPNLTFEVSSRIDEEIQNGRHYYELHGRAIAQLIDQRLRPDRAALAWHNDARYLG